MKRLAITAAVAASVGLAGCATNPYGYGYNDPYGYNRGYTDERTARTATGAAVGAVGGAIAGKVIPGVNTTTGAVAGAILGGVLGASINGRQYYRDTRGYCYYVDPRTGQAYYDYNVRC